MSRLSVAWVSEEHNSDSLLGWASRILLRQLSSYWDIVLVNTSFSKTGSSVDPLNLLELDKSKQFDIFLYFISSSPVHNVVRLLMGARTGICISLENKIDHHGAPSAFHSPWKRAIDFYQGKANLEEISYSSDDYANESYIGEREHALSLASLSLTASIGKTVATPLRISPTASRYHGYLPIPTELYKRNECDEVRIIFVGMPMEHDLFSDVVKAVGASGHKCHITCAIPENLFDYATDIFRSMLISNYTLIPRSKAAECIPNHDICLLLTDMVHHFSYSIEPEFSIAMRCGLYTGIRESVLSRNYSPNSVFSISDIFCRQEVIEIIKQASIARINQSALEVGKQFTAENSAEELRATVSMALEESRKILTTQRKLVRHAQEFLIDNACPIEPLAESAYYKALESLY